MSHPYDLKDITAFLQIARAGSMTNAAATYNVPKATLSLHLRRLEDALQVELFIRKAKGLELTDAGKEYLDNCAAIFDSCENAAIAAQRAHSTISGRIRIASSAEFGTTMIGAAAHYFSRAHPEIDFDLQMYPNDKIIAGQIDFDCMIFVGEPPDSSLLRRKLGTVSYGLYAGPAFLKRHGALSSIADINGLDGVVYHRNAIPEKWTLRNGNQVAEIKPYSKFNVNEYWMAKYFAVEGSVLGYLPDFFVKYEVELEALVSVLPNWRSENTAAYVLYPAQRHRNPRIMKLVDTMCSHFDEFIRYPGYSLLKTNFEPEARQP
ncbi:MAG: LysR family transcriptional regulator [Mesorhizobium sp.]